MGHSVEAMTALDDLPVVLLSHRGPVHFDREPRTHDRVGNRGGGGLVSALLGLATRHSDAVWVCAAASDEDRAVTEEAGGGEVRVALEPEPHPVPADAEVDGPTLRVRYVSPDPKAHDDLYTVIANPLLWFVQHGLYGLATAPVLDRRTHAAFDNGYAAVNDLFADVVAEEVETLGGRALVLVQDYHFYLVPERVRARCPDAVISHFVHIPWPSHESWRVLPPPLRERIFRGLLGADVVGFQTETSAASFCLGMGELLGLPVDGDRRAVGVGDREVLARTYPISVDVPALEQLARSEEVEENVVELTEAFLDDGRQLVLRVDRTDPSKNIVRGFLAFGELLDTHPELVGRVTFLALLQPSRQDVPEYADYIAAIGGAVAEVNARHGRGGQIPIDLRFVEDLPLAVAAYSVCDVLMVNAVADGMNLVAKEQPLVSRRDGVLALSESTGAFAELADFAVTLHPFDIAQQGQALYGALTMPVEQRRRLREGAAAWVRAHDIEAWLAAQMTDLAPIAERRSARW